MEMRIRAIEDRAPRRRTVGPQIADQVDHHGAREHPRIREPQTADRADMLLELRGRTRAPREVPAVVRARCDLVDQQATIGQLEHLDGEHADMAERLGDRQRDVVDLLLRERRDLRRCPRGVQDVLAMHVLRDGKRANLAEHAARDDRGDLAAKRHDLLEHRIGATQPGPRGRRIRQLVDAELALAVIAGAAVLDDALPVEPLEARTQIELARDRCPARLRHAETIEELLLDLTILDRAQHARARPHRRVTLELLEDLGRDMLGIERDHVDLLREQHGRFEIVERPDDDAIGDLRGRAARIRIEHDDAIAHRARRERHHPAELAPAEHADRLTGKHRSRWTHLISALPALI